MPLNEVLPFLSTGVMASFAVVVFRRYWRRRLPHLLLWGIGLTMFGIGSFAEAYSILAWSPTVFLAWYLFGAMLNAGWIGQGTIYLLAKRPFAHVSAAVLVVLSLVGMVGMLTLPLNTAGVAAPVILSELYREILPTGAWIRSLTPIFNIYGLVALVGGAIYSAWLFWRKKTLMNRMWGNVLIAVGAISIGSASSLTRLGIGEYLYLGELIAATLMFAGFLLATQRAPERQAQRAAGPLPASG
ncbi:MAG: hypothetical protein HY685_05225 [Chloroflexi bacterium]|nr:hypothetical protein [Chloroflexota bacterium]